MAAVGGGDGFGSVSGSGGCDGRAAGFSLVDSTSKVNAEDRRMELEAECKQQALGTVCEYLDNDWGRKLAEKCR